MSRLSSILTRTLASAVVTTAALAGNAIAAGCGGACAPKRTAAKSGACGAKGCGAKCGTCNAKAAKVKAKAKATCGAKCGAKCGACKAGSGAACAAKK